MERVTRLFVAILSPLVILGLIFALPDLVRSATDPIYSQDFESYTVGADPDDWYDSGVNNSLTEDAAKFQIHELGGDKVFGSTSGETNIHSHYIGIGSDTFTGYEYTGRMMTSHSRGGIGVTFMSQFPQEAAYYRLRRYGGNAFRFSPLATSISGGTTDTGVVPLAGVWYRFKIQVEDTGNQTEMRARVWQEGTVEPANWQADAYDSSPTRLTEGTIGLWGMPRASRYWDDLAVNPLAPPNAVPPVITILGANPVDVEAGQAYVDAGATAADDVDGDLTGSIITISTVNTNTVGAYSVTYEVSDSSSNPDTAVRVVNVVDTTPPVITILGDAPATAEIGQVYIDAGATAFDAGDGDLTASIVANSTVITGTIGAYSVTYEVSDSFSNMATAVRAVDVLDTTPPVITILGDNPAVVEADGVYNDAGATAYDVGDGELTLSIVATSTVNTDTIGNYTVTYGVGDSYGNTASVDRTVNVVAPGPPIITILGDNPATAEVGQVYNDAGATAIDGLDGDLTGNIVTTSTVNTNTVGSYSVTYEVTDSSGNTASSLRAVNVVDTAPPVITILGDNPATVEVGSVYIDAGATAVDAGDGELTGSIVVTSNVITDTIGNYTVTYEVGDGFANLAMMDRTVNVVDSTATVTYMEDFEIYDGGDDPIDWYDSGVNNSLTEDATKFQIHELGGDKVFGTASEETNIHSHYIGIGSDTFTGYEYTGRMMIAHRQGGIGVTFMSQFPQEAAYYRLRRFGGNAFHINPLGTSISGGTTDTGVVPLAGIWYRFKIQVEDTGSQTEIRARVWQEGTVEPANWQADAYDSNPTRLTEGTIGIWSFSRGSKYWDDLAVNPIPPPGSSQLTVAAVPDGSVGVDPIQPEYDFGEVVTLTATAVGGWQFYGWSGDLVGNTNPMTLTMTGNKIVTATFYEIGTLGWGSIDISTDSNGDMMVTLENSEIKVVYKQSSNNWAVEENGRPSSIDEFLVKDMNEDIVDGGRFDNHLYQTLMTSAQVVYDGVDKKTVYMTWQGGAKQEISIFPDSRILQIDYIDWGFLIADWPDWPKGNNTWQEQMIEVYGADLWHRTIDPADKPTQPDGWSWDPTDPTHFPNDPNAMREWGLGYSEIYFDRIPSDAAGQGEIDPADAGPLNYNGHFIMGAHKLATGVGYGRTLPVDRTRAIVLWSYRGWEFTPTGGSPFTSYLYPVTDGKQEILSLGQQLVDGLNPP